MYFWGPAQRSIDRNWNTASATYTHNHLMLHLVHVQGLRQWDWQELEYSFSNLHTQSLNVTPSARPRAVTVAQVILSQLTAIAHQVAFMSACRICRRQSIRIWYLRRQLRYSWTGTILERWARLHCNNNNNNNNNHNDNDNDKTIIRTRQSWSSPSSVSVIMTENSEHVELCSMPDSALPLSTSTAQCLSHATTA